MVNPAQPAPGRKRVLVVDDEASIREVLAEFLSLEGYETRTASNGQEALAVLDTWRPDAIILDLMMPVMDGWAFAKAAYRRLGPEGVPILVASASLDLVRAASELRPHGVRASLAKPFDLDVLLAAITRLVERTTADAWPAA